MISNKSTFPSDLVSENYSGLYGIYTDTKVRPGTIIQAYLELTNPKALIIDINHRWSSTALNDNSRIIHPKGIGDVLKIIRDIGSFVHPNLSFVFIDDLPLYFRNYYGSDKLYTQNHRLFGYCLALLKRLSLDIPVLFSTYAYVMNRKQSIYNSHVVYYVDKLFRIVGDKNNFNVEQVF